MTPQANTTHSLRAVIAPVADLLDEKAAAAVLDVSPGTLSVWRSTGRYTLPFLKVGRKVRYRRADLMAWLDSRTRATGATA
ncbi:DNA-binding protein [Zoogloea oleivorans]|uniref:DNA-binding protein n=1 Tax=Zoogloea oleivorans TaxID=1552750 RepID=A0A6C2D5T6_9RHOO|nr:helix-turn-helix domain-containing protein [Zoogloea oleivorans]TYC61341.1 DNA-binding protein [Zoogloea oleivorans]